MFGLSGDEETYCIMLIIQCNACHYVAWPLITVLKNQHNSLLCTSIGTAIGYWYRQNPIILGIGCLYGITAAVKKSSDCSSALSSMFMFVVSLLVKSPKLNQLFPRQTTNRKIMGDFTF